MKKLALIGGSGFAKEVAEIARLRGFVVEDYFADCQGQIALKYGGYLDDLIKRRHEFAGVALAIGGINRRGLDNRKKLIEWLDKENLPCPELVSPSAILAAGVTIAAGSFVAHNVIVSVDARIGRFALLNTSAVIGHDAVLEQNVTISPLAFVGGAVRIGADSLLGAAAKVMQGLEIGEDVIIGMGCTVVRSVPPHQTVLPNLRRA